MKFFLGIIFIVLSGCGLFAAWEYVSFVSFKSGAVTDVLIVDVPPGRSFSSVSNQLGTDGAVKRADYFRWYARLQGKDKALKVGEYQINRAMTPAEILNVLASGQGLKRTVTIPEGTHMYDVALFLEQKGLGSKESYIQMFKNPELSQELLGQRLYSLEGYLFPETYHFTKYMTQKEIIKKMVDTFLRVYNDVSEGKPHAMSRHQIVTLASVVEKETGAKFERPRIASVFFNRLQKRMRLQSDPTILYGMMDLTGVMPKNISRRDILRPNRFNTYTIPALPFGPVANPGREALLSVFKPETSPYLYFVSQNDGSHIFSETYEEHNKAVKKYQIDRRAREGKSWRDLRQ